MLLVAVDQVGRGLGGLLSCLGRRPVSGRAAGTVTGRRLLKGRKRTIPHLR